MTSTSPECPSSGTSPDNAAHAGGKNEQVLARRPAPRPSRKKPKSPYIPDSTWERHRAEITSLYQQGTLDSLRKEMQKRHQFDASVSQYKLRIHKWNLDKKKKEDEMKTIVYLHQQRSRMNKRSIFIVRGQLMDFHDVLRYFARKGKSIEDLDFNGAEAVADTVRCISPISDTIDTPSELGAVEHILFASRGYIQASLARGLWVESTNGLRSSANHENHALLNFFHGVWLASELLDRGRDNEGIQTLIASAALVQELLLNQEPELLFYIFDVVAQILDIGRQDLAMSLLRQFLLMARTVLQDQGRPLTIILAVAIQNISHLRDAIPKFFLISTDQVENELGLLHPFHVRKRHMYINRFVKDPYAKAKMLQDLLEESVTKSGPYTYGSLLLQLSLIYHTSKAESFMQTVQTAETLISKCPHLKARMYLSIQSHFLVAQAQHALGNLREAEAQFMQAIELIDDDTFGPSSSLLARCLDKLEQFAMRSGNQELADKARQGRIAVITHKNGGEVQLEGDVDFGDLSS